VILTLARKLKIEVIAEGVEKPSQVETLRTMGCPLAQGYLFSSPLDASAALQLLQKLQTFAADPSAR
jgi:EAL domain-containing protein (putative c-di-GMP-specific phosphodiesterase class I)